MRKTFQRTAAGVLAVMAVMGSTVTSYAAGSHMLLAAAVSESAASDGEYPLAGMLEQVGLNDGIAEDENQPGDPLRVDGKYYYENRITGIPLYAVVCALSGKTLRGSVSGKTDPARVISEADGITYGEAVKVVARIREFMNSFDWKQADELTKAQKAAEFVTKDAAYVSMETSGKGHLTNILLYKEGSCTDYSAVYQTLARLVGLDCITVKVDGHEWNYVKARGKWLWLDASCIAKFGSDYENYTEATQASLERYAHRHSDPDAPWEETVEMCRNLGIQ